MQQELEDPQVLGVVGGLKAFSNAQINSYSQPTLSSSLTLITISYGTNYVYQTLIKLAAIMSGLAALLGFLLFFFEWQQFKLEHYL